MGQSGGASRWRVCYQRGLPRLVHIRTNMICNQFQFEDLITAINGQGDL